MATSSIFHNIVINDPKKANAFVAALDASIADPYKRPDGPLTHVVSDKSEILRLHELRKIVRQGSVRCPVANSLAW